MSSMEPELTRDSVLKQVGPGFSETDARAIVEHGPEATIFAILTLAKRVAELTRMTGKADPPAPSGQMATFLKPKTKGRYKSPGARPGQPGSRRETPKPDKTVPHSLECCPDCSGSVSKCNSSRSRIIEDLQEDSRPLVTEHVLSRYWCSHCRKKVEPVVEDALPDSQIGHRAICLAGMMHYLQGTTLSQILDVYNYHLHFPVTEGGLVQAWHRIGEIFRPWYDGFLNSYGDGSERGAQTQSVLMTIMCTLKMCGHNPVQILVDALKSYVRSGKLPPLPTKITANG